MSCYLGSGSLCFRAPIQWDRVVTSPVISTCERAEILWKWPWAEFLPAAIRPHFIDMIWRVFYVHQCIPSKIMFLRSGKNLRLAKCCAKVAESLTDCRGALWHVVTLGALQSASHPRHLMFNSKRGCRPKTDLKTHWTNLNTHEIYWKSWNSAMNSAFLNSAFCPSPSARCFCNGTILSPCSQWPKLPCAKPTPVAGGVAPIATSTLPTYLDLMCSDCQLAWTKSI